MARDVGCDVGCDPRLEIRAPYFRLDRQPGTGEPERRLFGARQRALELPDRVMELVAELLVDHRDHPADRVRVERGAAQLLELRQACGDCASARAATSRRNR